jgi:hypothetical protein
LKSDDERERHATPRTSDPCQFCGNAEAFVMMHDAPWPTVEEIEGSAVLLKTCVIAPRWRWCWKEQRMIASLRSHLDERFATL